MRIVLFGSNGWIGKQLIPFLINHELICIEERIISNKQIQNILDKQKPERVFMTLGRTYLPSHRKPDNFKEGGITGTIDDLEHPSALPINMNDNLYIPILIAEECKKRNIHCTYFGTGCIYEYTTEQKTDEFTETDEPNYTGSAYSIIKSYTDRLMQSLYSENVLTLRIRMPISKDNHPRNFISKLLKYKTIVSIPNSMSVLSELLPIAVQLSERGVTGLLNFVNPGAFTHRELLEMVSEIYKIPLSCQITENPEAIRSLLIARRSNNCLSTKRLETLVPEIMPIRDSLRKLLQEMYQEGVELVSKTS